MRTRAATIDRPATRTEIFLGRSLAACVHPWAAWRLSSWERLRLIVGYLIIGYITVLGVLALRAMLYGG
jgi:hypothetical protein